MFEKKAQKCLGVAAVVGISTPTLIGTIIKLIANSKTIVNTAKQVKEGIEAAKLLSNDIANNIQDTPETSEGVIIDMG